MALTVETGAGVVGANTYEDVAYVEAYCTDLGLTTFPALTTALKEAAILRCMAFLESLDWAGSKVDQDNPLEWPRAYVYDRNGYLIDSDVIPEQLKKALAEGAYQESVTPGIIQPTVDLTQVVRRERVDVLETEYAASNSQLRRTSGKEFNRLWGYLQGLGTGWPFTKASGGGGCFEIGRG